MSLCRMCAFIASDTRLKTTSGRSLLGTERSSNHQQEKIDYIAKNTKKGSDTSNNRYNEAKRTKLSNANANETIPRFVQIMVVPPTKRGQSETCTRRQRQSWSHKVQTGTSLKPLVEIRGK